MIIRATYTETAAGVIFTQTVELESDFIGTQDVGKYADVLLLSARNMDTPQVAQPDQQSVIDMLDAKLKFAQKDRDAHFKISQTHEKMCAERDMEIILLKARHRRQHAKLVEAETECGHAYAELAGLKQDNVAQSETIGKLTAERDRFHRFLDTSLERETVLLQDNLRLKADQGAQSKAIAQLHREAHGQQNEIDLQNKRLENQAFYIRSHLAERDELLKRAQHAELGALVLEMPVGWGLWHHNEKHWQCVTTNDQTGWKGLSSDPAKAIEIMLEGAKNGCKARDGRVQ